MTITHTARAARWPLIVCAVVATFGASVAAQLASRPADEWRKVLDAPERIAALKVNEVIARLRLKPTDVVADLGAGTGPFVVPFAKAVPSGAVYAVEVDEGFLPLIREKTRAAGITNAQTVLGIFTDPKLPAPVDLALMNDVLHHVQDRAAYLKTLASQIKRGGRLAIVDFKAESSPHKGNADLIVTESQVNEWATYAGLERTDTFSLYTDRYFVIYTKR